MTAEQKRRLIRHIESALRDYERLRHRNARGESAQDRSMREAYRAARITAENNIADCRETLEMVRVMKSSE